MRTQFFSSELKEISKKNKNIMFKAFCVNYATKEQYYILNGKIALAESFNTNYAFTKDLRRFSDIQGIYELKQIKNSFDSGILYTE